MSNKQQQAKGKTGENYFSFTRFWSRHKSPIIITLVCFAVYSNSLFNGYNLDDELVTKKHPLTSQGIKAIPEIFSSPYYSDDMGYAYDYRPLVHVSFAIEHQLFGEHVAVSHMITYCCIPYSVFSCIL
ncbi:MAG: hypothetical protein IPN22_11290 [Bacteroidetes bacterium]|nr:hypothetical protein [Bacteroidota bacterium]